jgi:transglutaminase-like putative cysteine protease
MGSGSLNVQAMAYPGMKAVVSIIKKVIETYRGRQFVRDKALQLTQRIAKNKRTNHPDMRDFDAIADAIYDYVIDKAIYTRDPNGIERLQMPDATIALGSGDCDDMVILSGALLESVGVPTRIRLLGEQPNTFTHILLDYKSNGVWKSFDPTLALYPGYKIPAGRIKASKIVPINRPGLAGMPAPSNPVYRHTGSSYIN